MSGLFTNIKEKVNAFANEETITKEDITPRNNKGVVVGEYSESAAFDTSDELCVVRNIKLFEDQGTQINTIISRLEKGQLVVVDFSDSEEKQKDAQFYTLWGATMALHGTFKFLDKNGDLVLFTNGENKIGEEIL